MSKAIQAVRGMNDTLAPETSLWRQVETRLRECAQSFGFQEIRLPLVEHTDLFKRTIGDATDIVEKEMYLIESRDDESLTLRPEGTAGCIRAAIEHSLYRSAQKLWYCGPFFRRERPQKGRLRQFHQFGAEVLGISGPDIDAELILLSARMLKRLGLQDEVTLQLNSLGSKAARAAYREILVSYFNNHKDQLDEDSLRRLETNPLRILDSKNPDLKTVIEAAPKLIEHLDPESAEHFKGLCKLLDQVGLAYTINPTLVRGLDYYTRTVFEWVTTKLGAQGTVCAGGRYDELIEQLGGNATPALGFGLGIERVILLMQDQPPLEIQRPLHAYFVTDSDETFAEALKLTETLRDQLPELQITLHSGGGNLSNQFKKANKSGAHLALILAENERKSGSIAIKNLRENQAQEVIPQANLAEFLIVARRSAARPG